MGAYATVYVKNDAEAVISFTTTFDYDGQPTKLERGNFPKGDGKTDQIPIDATNINVLIKFEHLVNEWRTAFDQTYPDTSGWPDATLSLYATGDNDTVHVKSSS